MNKLILTFIFATFSQSSFGFDSTHKQWTDILAKYQTAEGLIRYKDLKSDETKGPNHPFALYLKSLSEVPETEFNKWSKNDKKAFLINAYNALTVKLILDHYPVKSIKKIGGFFSKPWSLEFFSLLDGKIKSLDPIEHKWLRPIYKDYRIHAAVNCASFSCPPLRHEAFQGSKLDAQLDDQMKAWLQDKTRNQLDPAHKVFKVSKIFDWYKKDFDAWGGGVVAVINHYMNPPVSRDVAKEIEIQYLDYNWDLNEAK